MIGQQNLISNIDKVIDRYPKFTIIVGPKGSGKKLICKYICDKLGISIITFGQKIEEVRQVIDMAYEQTKPICYLLPDADTMSIGAKNCLLKVTEEPPQNAYFIITLQSLENTLETLKSRGTVWTLDNYSDDEIIAYRSFRKYKSDNDNLVKHICNTTGEVDELFKTDIVGFYKYAEIIADYIDKINSGNIFKISKALKLKDSDEGYNPILMFKTVRDLYIEKAIESRESKYLLASKVTSNCIRELNIPTLNKQATIDNWILEVRKALR